MYKGQVNIKVGALIKLPNPGWPEMDNPCCGSHYPQIHLSARPGSIRTFLLLNNSCGFYKLN